MHRATARWFVRAIAIVTAIAFLSYGAQADALVGTRGLFPFDQLLATVRREHGGTVPWTSAPTWLWWAPTDTGLKVTWGIGVVAALVAAAGWFEGPALMVCLGAYLSLSTVSQRFLGFQWDTLLTETLFVGLFVASWRPRGRDAPEPARAAIWVARLLGFKLMFLAGLVKLTSGDPLWRDLTALTVHYETQPLPNPLAWYAHHLPVALHRAACAGMFAVELFVPFALFGPPAVRRRAFWASAALMGGLFVTGNYGFFQLLTVALLVVWLDDDAVPALRLDPPAPRPRWIEAPALALAMVWVPLSVALGLDRVGAIELGDGPVAQIADAARPWRVVNAYGLFANMTELRPELTFEGSDDGVTWSPYALRYKPGPLDRRPPIVAPHMPRLDWQLWFAALGDCRRNAWVRRVQQGLADGDARARSFFAIDPFGPRGAAEVRVVRTVVAFSDRGPAWWRETRGPEEFCPRARRGAR